MKSIFSLFIGNVNARYRSRKVDNVGSPTVLDRLGIGLAYHGRKACREDDLLLLACNSAEHHAYLCRGVICPHSDDKKIRASYGECRRDLIHRLCRASRGRPVVSRENDLSSLTSSGKPCKIDSVLGNRLFRSVDLVIDKRVIVYLLCGDELIQIVTVLQILADRASIGKLTVHAHLRICMGFVFDRAKSALIATLGNGVTVFIRNKGVNYLVSVLIDTRLLFDLGSLAAEVLICVYLLFVLDKVLCLLKSIAHHNVSYVKALARIHSAVYSEISKIILLVLVNLVSRNRTVRVFRYRLCHIGDYRYPTGKKIVERHTVALVGAYRFYRDRERGP